MGQGLTAGCSLGYPQRTEAELFEGPSHLDRFRGGQSVQGEAVSPHRSQRIPRFVVTVKECAVADYRPRYRVGASPGSSDAVL